MDKIKQKRKRLWLKVICFLLKCLCYVEKVKVDVVRITINGIFIISNANIGHLMGEISLRNVQ